MEIGQFIQIQSNSSFTRKRLVTQRKKYSKPYGRTVLETPLDIPPGQRFVSVVQYHIASQDVRR